MDVCQAFLRKLGRTTDKARRLRIVAACARVPRPWSEELLWEALADPHQGVRELAVKELLGRPSLSPEWSAGRLRRPPWYARSLALAVIGRKRLEAAFPSVKEASEDPNVDVRRAAAEALGEFGGEAALRQLVRLRKDPSPHVRAAAETAIARTSGVRFS